MKRILALLLALTVLFSFSACSLSAQEVQQLGELAGELIEAAAEISEEAEKPAPLPVEEMEEPTEEPAEQPVEEPQEQPVEEPEELPVEEPQEQPVEKPAGGSRDALDPDGVYTKKNDVALYLHTYGHLPGNFITKKEARELGWNGGGLDGFADGMCIGGDYFGNYEGQLPKKKGRSYYECDIDTLHSSTRGAKRIIFSDDGLIYYTSDHYESFTLLYGEE